jgi:hypothetical protein
MDRVVPDRRLLHPRGRDQAIHDRLSPPPAPRVPPLLRGEGISTAEPFGALPEREQSSSSREAMATRGARLLPGSRGEEVQDARPRPPRALPQLRGPARTAAGRACARKRCISGWRGARSRRSGRSRSGA